MKSLIITILVILSLYIPQDHMECYDPFSETELVEVIHFVHSQSESKNNQALAQRVSSLNFGYILSSNSELKSKYPVLRSPELYRKLICVYRI